MQTLQGRGRRATPTLWRAAPRWLTPLVAPLFVLGCHASADVKPHSGTDTDAATDTDQTVRVPVPPPIGAHRLTQRQLLHEIEDVFGVEFHGRLPDDLRIDGDPNLGSGMVGVSSVDAETLEAAGWAVGALAALDTASVEARLGCRVVNKPWEDRGPIVSQCVRSWLADVLPRAYRRPVQQDEVDTLAAVEEAVAADADHVAGMQAVVATIVQSPSFLYRFEFGEPDPNHPGELRATGEELASRLSYFLTDSAPDDALVADGRAGRLRDPDVRRAHAVRLIATPRGRESTVAYVGSLFHVDELPRLEKDPALFPAFDAELVGAMADDVNGLIASVLLDQQRPYADLFTTDEAWVRGALFDVYGIDGGSAVPVQAQIPAEQRRGGVLGRAAVLAVGAHATQNSPVRRGKLVRSRLLCQPVPPPPPGVNTNLNQLPDPDLTLRERLEEHVADPVCASCHKALDPIGFGFEGFDAIGQSRTTDNNRPVDAHGDLDGVTFDDAAGLGTAVAAHPDLLPCFLLGSLGHATGTNTEAIALDDLRPVAEEATRNGATYEALMQALVASEWFERASPPVDVCSADEEGTTRACDSFCGAGLETCTDGVWHGCDAKVEAFESCDAVDQDCDGMVDDLVEACVSDLGPGVSTCTDGGWSECAGPPPPPETCNGQDDDLDGLTDEDLPISFLSVDESDMPTHCFSDLPSLNSSPECEDVGPRVCGESGCAITGGSLREIDTTARTGMFVCLDDTQVTLSLIQTSRLLAYQPTCTRVDHRFECQLAAAAWCADEGKTTGFATMTTDTRTQTEEVACVEGATVLTTSYGELSALSPDCDGVVLQSGPACHDAIHALCRESGFLTGIGPVGLQGDVVSVACLGSAP